MVPTPPAAVSGAENARPASAASPGPSVVLHIGLHKAATRFLQRVVFARLDPKRFLVNPPELVRALKRAIRFPGIETRAAVEQAAVAACAQAGERSLIVSEPTISGDMYSAHEDWPANRELVHALFPEATIVYFTRRHSSWLQSAYRQQLAKGVAIPVETFLNFRDGDFRERPHRFVGGARTTNARDLQFLAIYRDYAEAFGAARVYLFRQEDLSRRPEAVYIRLSEALGLESLPDFNQAPRHNRAFSALAIRLFFPGVHREPQWTGRIEYRSRVHERLARTGRRLRTAFIQHVFDKIVYRDRDLLTAHGMRERLDAHYEAENRAIERVAAEILTDGPGPRVLSLAEEWSPG